MHIFFQPAESHHTLNRIVACVATTHHRPFVNPTVLTCTFKKKKKKIVSKSLFHGLQFSVNSGLFLRTALRRLFLRLLVFLLRQLFLLLVHDLQEVQELVGSRPAVTAQHACREDRGQMSCCYGYETNGYNVAPELSCTKWMKTFVGNLQPGRIFERSRSLVSHQTVSGMCSVTMHDSR